MNYIQADFIYAIYIILENKNRIDWNWPFSTGG